jgi:hypothetical protein
MGHTDGPRPKLIPTKHHSSESNWVPYYTITRSRNDKCASSSVPYLQSTCPVFKYQNSLKLARFLCKIPITHSVHPNFTLSSFVHINFRVTKALSLRSWQFL